MRSNDKKYEKIKTGDSVKWYYVKTIQEELNVFAFKRGSHPQRVRTRY